MSIILNINIFFEHKIMRAFSDRHIGISSTDEKSMKDFLGLESLEHLIQELYLMKS